MRGHVDPQSHIFSYFSPEQRVPANHPLRSIKAYTDSTLKQIRLRLDGNYSEIGRDPAGVRAEGAASRPVIGTQWSAVCETLDYTILFR